MGNRVLIAPEIYLKIGDTMIKIPGPVKVEFKMSPDNFTLLSDALGESAEQK